MNKEVFEIKVGDIFTEQKSRELIEYLKAKDKELEAQNKELLEEIRLFVESESGKSGRKEIIKYLDKLLNQ